jgi:hypothetical protein
MPAPYHELYGPLAALGALGSGALGVPTVSAANVAPVVLTGTFQAVASFSATIGQGARINVTGQLIGTNTSPGVDAELHMRVLQDGVAITPDVIAAMPTTGDAASTSWSVIGLRPSAGTHTYSLQAKATGDGGITVDVGAGVLILSPGP